MIHVVLASLALSQAQTPANQTIAVLPLYTVAGTKTAIDTIETTTADLLTKSGCEILPSDKVLGCWYGTLGNSKNSLRLTPKDYYYDLPRAADLLKLGRALNCDFVMAYRARFNDSTVWQGVGPKTKATVTTDVMIIDAKKATIELDARGVKSDGSVEQTMWRTASEILLSTQMVALLGGGPVTPIYQKAGIQSISVAMEPWLEKHKLPHSPAIKD